MSTENPITEIPVAPSSEPSAMRLIGTLAVSGLLSGLILVFAYVFTLPIIERNKELALQEAIYHVLPGCRSFDALVLVDGNLKKQIKEPANASGGSQTVRRIFLGFDDKGAVIGFAIPASEAGFQDFIKLIYGYDAGGKIIIGYEVLESKETPGLGDKIFRDKHFVANFTALSVEPSIQGTKTGAKTSPNQVETITGATISSKAVIRALQKSMDEWRPAMEKYLAANQLSYRQP